MTLPSSSFVMQPSPSLSNKRNASRNSKIKWNRSHELNRIRFEIRHTLHLIFRYDSSVFTKFSIRWEKYTFCTRASAAILCRRIQQHISAFFLITNHSRWIWNKIHSIHAGLMNTTNCCWTFYIICMTRLKKTANGKIKVWENKESFKIENFYEMKWKTLKRFLSRKLLKQNNKIK